MALDLSKITEKLTFFNRLDARARVFVLLGATIAFIFIIYLSTRWLTGSSQTIGPSKVANAPRGLQSVPGDTLTPEYQRALVQANSQASESAKMTGTSAIPTSINAGDGMSGNQCTIICSDQTVKINPSLEDWVRQGKVTPEVAAALIKLSDSNASTDEFAANLDDLVKQGKLSPEQARELLAQYKKQHANTLLQESASTMDAMIKSGQLPLDVANQLLTSQKVNASPAEYAAQIQQLVRDGKLSAGAGQQLVGQYAQQYSREMAKKEIAELQKMAKDGQITSEVLDALTKSVNQNVPADQLDNQLKQLVSQGKLTPAAADKILASYRKQKSSLGGMDTMVGLVQQAEGEAFTELDMLLDTKKISNEVSDTLRSLINNKVPFDQFQKQVQTFQEQGKLTAEIAQFKIDDYTKVTRLRDAQNKLNNLQLNNARPDQFAAELKNAVGSGIITPEQAAKMMQEYVDLTNKNASTAAIVSSSGAEEFAAMQQRLQQGNPASATISDRDFNVAQTQANSETAQERQARLETMLNSMSGQASQLINSWQPQAMKSVAGSAATSTKVSTTIESLRNGRGSKTGAGTDAAASDRPLIKAGSIIFAVLDTAVNSDYPASPVMATIVQGEFKGSKLLGKITTTKGVSGQMDRVMLNFTMMNKDEWNKTKAVTAYAIDPDTARTVLASDVDYHYLMRFGAIFATSFIQGYASAIQNSGSTVTNGFLGTSTQHPKLSPGEKLATAIGQIGQNLGSVTQKYVERPPTVRVDAGVGLGILFMGDVV